MVKVRLTGKPDEVKALADEFEESGAVLERSRVYPNRDGSGYVRVYIDMEGCNNEAHDRKAC